MGHQHHQSTPSPTVVKRGKLNYTNLQMDITVVTLPLAAGLTLLSSAVTDLRSRFFGGKVTATVSSL